MSRSKTGPSDWSRYEETGLPTPNMAIQASKNAQVAGAAWIRSSFRQEIPLFAKTVFPGICTFSIPPFHREIYTSLRKFKRVVVVAPRAFAKSTIVMMYLIHSIVFEKAKDVILLSATGPLAEERLSLIKREFETNEMLIALFGDLKGDIWRQDVISLRNGAKVRAKGRGYQIRGFRPDLIILDDVEDDEVVRSQEQLANLDDWFWKAVVPTIDAGKKKLVIIGNYLGPECFLRRLADTIDAGVLKGWTLLRYTAEIEGKSIWPDKWTEEELSARKMENAYAYACEYQNEPLPRGDARIKPDWIRYYDRLPHPVRYYVTVDLAISEKEKACDTAVMATASDGANRLYAVEYSFGKFTPYQTLEVVFDYVARHRPIAVGVESVAYQKAFIFMLREEMRRRGVYFGVEEIPGDGSKFRKHTPLVSRIEHGTAAIKPDHKELHSQLTMLTNAGSYGRCDLVDAFAMGERMAFPVNVKAQSFAKPPVGSVRHYIMKKELEDRLLRADAAWMGW